MARQIRCSGCDIEFTTFMRPGEQATCKQCGEKTTVVEGGGEVDGREALRGMTGAPGGKAEPRDPEIERLVSIGRQKPPPTAPIYSLAALGVGTFFGGILGGFFLISRNELAFGDEDAARKTLGYGLVGAVLFLALIAIVPEEWPIPNSVFHWAQIGAVLGYATNAQRARAKAHKELEGPFHSKWRAAGIGLVFGLVTVAGYFAILVAVPALQ